MMNLICAIPENIGWIIGGAVAMLTLEICGVLIGTVVNMIRERLTDYDDDLCED